MAEVLEFDSLPFIEIPIDGRHSQKNGFLFLLTVVYLMFTVLTLRHCLNAWTRFIEVLVLRV